MPIVLDPIQSDDPSNAPVTVEQAITHLRLDTQTDAEREHLALLILAATQYAEKAMNVSLMPRTRTVRFFDGEPLSLPYGPVRSVTEVLDGDEEEVTDYTIKTVGHATLVCPDRSITYPVQVTYAAGYEDAPSVPAEIRVAILAHVGSLYENRESVNDRTKTPVPHSLESFYRVNRRSVSIR